MNLLIIGVKISKDTENCQAKPIRGKLLDFAIY